MTEKEADRRASITGQIELMGGFVQVSVTGNPNETSDEVLNTFEDSVDKMAETVADVPEVEEEERSVMVQ